MDKEQAAITAALQDHQGRWSELVSLTVEINRWRSLYIAALIAGTAWTVQVGGDVSAIAADKAELLFALSLFNAFFMVSQAWKSWAIHEIGRHCYEFLGLRITRLTGFPFAVWDEWRRNASGAPGLAIARKAFWYIETLASIFVSFGLLVIGGLYGGLTGPAWWVWTVTTLLLDGLMFVYVVAVAWKGERLWAKTIDARAALEDREWRYQPLQLVAEISTHERGKHS